MRTTLLAIAVFLVALTVGCDSNPAPKPAPPPPAQLVANPAELAASAKERATELAAQARQAMTEPAIMKLPVGSRPEFVTFGFRGERQIKAAMPHMRKLVMCGKAADESLWQLINDADEGVRRTSVILLNPRYLIGGDFIPSQPLYDVAIPLLERVLTAKDSEVRYWACAGLGDQATWSDEGLDLLKTCPTRIRELRDDSDKDVRGIAQIAWRSILRELSQRAKRAEDRKAAAAELERFQHEKEW